MKNAAMGEPYAGNPHVRFDEGEVTSAKSRRGSLLYKRMMLFALIVGCCQQGSAATNRYALVTAMGGSSTLYRLSEEGDWMRIRIAVKDNDGHTENNCRALSVDGIIYTFDMNDNETSYVRKYAPNGSWLGDLGSCPGQAEGLCLSSDRKSLYLGFAFGTEKGKILKMSLKDGSCTTVATGLGIVRQLCTDGRGHLYAAKRDGKLRVIDEATGEITTFDALSGAQGIAYDPENDLLWWSKYNSSDYGTLDHEGTVTTYSGAPWGTSGCFAVKVIDGFPHFAVYNNSICRRNADGTFVTVESATAKYSDLTTIEVEEEDVANVYVTVAGRGVKRFTVTNGNKWQGGDDWFIAANGESGTTRPIACRRIGRTFYVLDQFEDKDLGYFSIDKYNLTGEFKGRLVDKWVCEGIKVDNMTTSTDEKSLYVTCYSGNKLLKVDVATGSVAELTSEDLHQPRGCSADRSGEVYVCNRTTTSHVTVYGVDGSKITEFSFGNSSGIYCDRDLDLVYVVSNGGYGRAYRKADLSTYFGAFAGLGNTLSIDKVKDGWLDNLVFVNWGGEVWTMPTGSTSPSQVLSGLGNLQHVFVDPIDRNPPRRGMVIIVR